MTGFKVVSRPTDAGGFRVVSRPETPVAPPMQFSPAGVPYEPDPATGPVVQSADPDPYRALKIGTQAVGQGLADIPGAPADIAGLVGKTILSLAQGGINLALPPDQEVDLKPGRFDSMFLGGDYLGEKAGQVADAAGFDRVPYDDMSKSEKMGYTGTRFASGAVAGGAGLAKAGSRAGASSIEKVFAAPYLAAGERAKDMGPLAAGLTKAGPLVADAAAGFGAGAGVEGAQDAVQALPEPLQPVATLVASLIGAQAGGRAAQVAALPKEAVKVASTNLRADPGAPVVDGKQATVAEMDVARRFMQENTVGEPKQVAQTIRDNAAELDAGLPATGDQGAQPPLPKPTSALLSKDPGLVAVEKGQRTRNAPEYMRSDQAVEQAAAGQVESLRVDGANQFAPRQRVESEVAQRRQAAAAETTAAQNELDATVKTNVERSIDARQKGNTELAAKDAEIAATKERVGQAQQAEVDTGATLRANAGDRKVAASENLAAAVDDAKAVDEAYKAGLYRKAESLGKDVPVDPVPFAEDARAIKAEISPLAAQDSTLNNVLDDLDRLAKPIGESVDGAEPVADLKLADLIAMRPRLSQAREAAVRLKRGDVTERIDRINGAIKGKIEELAASGDEAAVAWQDAEANFRDNFAPKYREGTGRQLDQAERSKNPVQPSKVAGKFLSSKEAAADLNRILTGAESEAAGRTAARDYVVADLASVVGADGKVNLRALEKWENDRAGVFQAEGMDGLREEVAQMKRDVVNKREATTALQKELDAKVAERKTRAADLKAEIEAIEGSSKLSEKEKSRKAADLQRQETELEREIQQSAAALFLDADPATSAARVFKQKDPAGAMREIVAKFKDDKAALAGWKDAVSEHLVEQMRTTGVARTGGNGQPVSFAGLTNMLNDGKTMRALQALYSPAEMNALRRSHKLAEYMQLKGMQANVGSPTAELQEQVLNNLEAGLLLAGNNAVTTGMIMKRMRVVLDIMPLSPARKAKAAAQLIERSSFDPELAAYLLDSKPTDIRLPQWNRKLMRYLSLTAAGREDSAED